MIGVEDNIPQLLKRCFHSNVEGLKLFHGPIDSPVGRLENMFPYYCHDIRIIITKSRVEIGVEST